MPLGTKPNDVRYKKLRIAWSVTWGVVAVLMVVLLMRSFKYTDMFESGRKLTTSHQGRIYTKHRYSSKRPMPPISRKRFDWFGKSVVWLTLDPTPISVEGGHSIHYCSLATIAGLIASVSWFTWSTRFSLRTLLIATTLVAIGLGLIIYATRG